MIAICPFGNIVKEMQELDVVKHDDRKGRESYYYTFTEVDIELASKLDLPNIELELTNDGLWYRYKDKAPILITEHNVLMTKDQSMKQCEKQAYHALSYFDRNGYVSRFKKL